MKPIGINVLIKVRNEEHKTESGLLLDSSKTPFPTGTVVSVGEGTKEHDMVLKSGDEVMYQTNAGVPVKYEGEEHILIPETKCISIL